MGLRPLGGASAAVIADAIAGKDNRRPSPTTPTPTFLASTDTGSGLTRYGAGWMSADRKRIYSCLATNLYVSTDSGATWSASLNTFPQSVHGVREMDNGELLVSTIGATGNAGLLFTSTGYKYGTGTAVFSQVLATTATTTTPAFNHAWGMSTWRNYVMVSEYSAENTAPNNARRVFLSSNYGATFTQIFDLANISTANGMHVHGCAIDPYEPRLRLWVTYGDNTQGILYSDDLGASWVTVSNVYQPVGIIPMEKCILFTSDAEPNGIYRIPRTTNKEARSVVEVAHAVDAAGTPTVLGGQHFRAQYDGAPVLIPFNAAASGQSGILVATLDGYHFYELWRDSLTYAQGSGLLRVVGPTEQGKIIGLVKDARFATAYTRFVMDAPTWT